MGTSPDPQSAEIPAARTDEALARQPLLDPPVAVGYLVLSLLLAIGSGASQVLAVAYFGLSLTAAWIVHADLRARGRESLGWPVAVALFAGFAYAPYALGRDRGRTAELTDRARPAAEAPAPAPAPARPTTAAPGEERPHLKELVAYLTQGEQLPPREYETECAAVVTTGLELPGTMSLGYYAPRLPFGKLYVYPEYLVFLTESHNPPGKVPAGGRILSVLLDAWRTVTFWRPIPLARTAYAHLTKEEFDRLRKPLGNPNSIVVPLSEIREVRQERWANMSYLTVVAGDREIALMPNGYVAVLASFSLVFLAKGSIRRSVAGIFFMPWEPNLRARLERAAAENASPTVKEP